MLVGFGLLQGNPDPEKALGDSLKARQNVAAVLKAVKDKQSAEAALPKLDEAMKALLAALAVQKKIKQDDPATAKVRAELASQIKAAQEAFLGEYNRLQKLPELHQILLKNQLWGKHLAASGIENLEMAVLTYLKNHTRYPDTLVELTERDAFDNSPALLLPKALTDPWGRPYGYDPTNLHPQTNKPMIYSQGPDPKDPKGRIDNWAD